MQVEHINGPFFTELLHQGHPVDDEAVATEICRGFGFVLEPGSGEGNGCWNVVIPDRALAWTVEENGITIECADVRLIIEV